MIKKIVPSCLILVLSLTVSAQEKFKELRFAASSFTEEQLLSEDFMLELSDVMISKSPNCKQKK